MFFILSVLGLCGTATVTADVLNVREGPGTNYNILFQIKKGTVVTTISKSNGWYKISYNNKNGYVSGDYIQSSGENTGKKGYVTADVLNIRSGPATTYSVLFKLTSGTTVNVISKTGNWYEISYDGKKGYACADYISTESTGSNKGAKIVSLARSKLGCTYVWGAEGPSTFDCSGLVMWCHKQVGITTPRVSRDQAQSGKAVSRSNLLPGDCVFFGNPIHHTGIYIGNGDFIHAPKTGDVVKISTLTGRSDYNCARRYW